MKKLGFLSLPFFLLIPISFSMMAGSSYFFTFQKCDKLYITANCFPFLNKTEFSFSPNCILTTYNSTFVEWECNCFDSYVLNFTPAPNSRVSCILEFESVYAIHLPREKIISRTVEIFYNNTYIYPEEKVVIVENKTKIQKLEEENERLREDINELKGKLSEFQVLNTTYQKTIKKLERRFSLLLFLFFIALFALILYFTHLRGFSLR